MKRSGFTLVELLAATALFSVLGLLLFEMTRGAADVWNTGERNREVHDRAAAAFELITTDLRHLWPGTPGVSEQDARLLGLYVEHDADADGAGAVRVPALAFTRVLHEERELDWLRRAGDAPGAQGASDLLEPLEPTQLRATGGLAETVYTLAALPGEDSLSLVRAVRTPVGGQGSLLEPQQLARLDRVLGGAVRVADGVLGLVVEYWAPGTTHWVGEAPADQAVLERDDAEGAADPATVGTASAGSPPGAVVDDDGTVALTSWDSTRGLLGHAFPHHRGEESVLDGRDDMIPRYLRLTLILDARLPQTELTEDLSPSSKRLAVRGTSFLNDEAAPDHVLVDQEWMALAAIQDGELLVERGARGSLVVEHREGAAVRVGRSFTLTLALPTARENYNR